MVVNSFLAGVLSTLFVELTALFIVAVVAAVKLAKKR